MQAALTDLFKSKKEVDFKAIAAFFVDSWILERPGGRLNLAATELTGADHNVMMSICKFMKLKNLELKNETQVSAKTVFCACFSYVFIRGGNTGHSLIAYFYFRSIAAYPRTLGLRWRRVSTKDWEKNWIWISFLR